jgi:hypothetical protein
LAFLLEVLHWRQVDRIGVGRYMLEVVAVGGRIVDPLKVCWDWDSRLDLVVAHKHYFGLGPSFFLYDLINIFLFIFNYIFIIILIVFINN